MLEYDPNKRYSAERCLEHEWFTKYSKTAGYFIIFHTLADGCGLKSISF